MRKNILIVGLMFSGVFLDVSGSSVEFFKGIIRNPRQVGAFFPSSGAVAAELVKPMNMTHENIRVLEIGGGTGQITATITKHLGARSLDVVELDPDYCDVLEQRFGSLPSVNIVRGSILDWNPEYKYDVIICTLPFNSFDLSLTRPLIEHIKKLAKPGAAFSYIELHGVTNVGKIVLPAEKKEKLKATLSFMHDFKAAHAQQSETVLYNVPPMYVHHCKL